MKLQKCGIEITCDEVGRENMFPKINHTYISHHLLSPQL